MQNLLDSSRKKVLLITGMSGSGRSFALKTFEDMGYETIDNLPLSFLEPIALANPKNIQPLAISIDIRTRDFSSEQFLELFEKLTSTPELNTQLIFFECDDDVLAKRYNATRRLHPLADEHRAIDGIRLERQLISLLKEHASIVIDTTMSSVSDLKGQLRRLFLPGKSTNLRIFITSFSFRHGLPREADMIFDTRLLRNPFYVEELQLLSGIAPEVIQYIQKDKVFPSFIKSLKSIISLSLQRFEQDGRGYLTIGIGCTGGQHRSVFVAEILKEWLQGTKNTVKLKHRDLQKSKRK